MEEDKKLEPCKCCCGVELSEDECACEYTEEEMSCGLGTEEEEKCYLEECSNE